jgi:hypothetical protein
MAEDRPELRPPVPMLRQSNFGLRCLHAMVANSAVSSWRCSNANAIDSLNIFPLEQSFFHMHSFRTNSSTEAFYGVC